MKIDWDKATYKEQQIIHDIVKRAVKLAKKSNFDVNQLCINMDITACHVSGCKLKLEELMKADDFNFSHDVFGISRHINRETGKLGNCFLPRFAA